MLLLSDQVGDDARALNLQQIANELEAAVDREERRRR